MHINAQKVGSKLESKKLVLANWKSHKTLDEAMHWLAKVGPKAGASPYSVVLCPPFPFLAPLYTEIQAKKYAIKLGVQDLSPFPAGSYTGAVSERTLEGLGVVYALLGHSERRRYFHETYQEVANKVDLAIEAKIQPIVCLRKEDISPQYSALSDDSAKKVIVLYETIGHIGTGEVESIESVLNSVQKIRSIFGYAVPIIYGGSVSDETRLLFLEHKELQGIVAATNSLDADEFMKMIRQTNG